MYQIREELQNQIDETETEDLNSDEEIEGEHVTESEEHEESDGAIKRHRLDTTEKNPMEIILQIQEEENELQNLFQVEEVYEEDEEFLPSHNHIETPNCSEASDYDSDCCEIIEVEDDNNYKENKKAKISQYMELIKQIYGSDEEDDEEELIEICDDETDKEVNFLKNIKLIKFF